MVKYTDEILNDLLMNYSESSSPDFLQNLMMFEKNIGELTDNGKFQLYLNLGNFYCFQKNKNSLELANKYVLMAERLIEGKQNNFKSDLYFTKGHLLARMGKEKESKKYFVKYILLYYSDNLNNLFDTPLYSFQRINEFLLSDLKNKEITLSDPNEFNDPFDILLYHFLEFRNEIIGKKDNYSIKSYSEAYKDIRIKCFVKDYIKENESNKIAFQNLLMWGHYADSHKGICIRYKFTLSPYSIMELFGKKSSFTNWYNVKYEPSIKFEDKGFAKMELLLATKKKDWEYEQEVRLLHLDPNCNDKFIQIPLIKLGGKIEAVIFGLKCANQDKKTIKSILDNDVEYFDFQKNINYSSNIYDLRLVDQERFDTIGT